MDTLRVNGLPLRVTVRVSAFFATTGVVTTAKVMGKKGSILVELLEW
jgi:hypothetical protein